MSTESVEVTITVPAALLDAGTAERARLLVVLDAVRSERLTWRAAAAALGMSLDEFLDVAKTHGVHVTQLDSDDLRNDLATLDALRRPNQP